MISASSHGSIPMTLSSSWFPIWLSSSTSVPGGHNMLNKCLNFASDEPGKCLEGARKSPSKPLSLIELVNLMVSSLLQLAKILKSSSKISEYRLSYHSKQSSIFHCLFQLSNHWRRTSSYLRWVILNFYFSCRFFQNELYFEFEFCIKIKEEEPIVKYSYIGSIWSHNFKIDFWFLFFFHGNSSLVMR